MPSRRSVPRASGRRALDAARETRDRVRAAWDANAEFWDSRMGDGNEFHRLLNAPTLERLLRPRARERIVDLACGNGQFARHLAAVGAHVVAVDMSAKMLARAGARTTPSRYPIEYRVLDVTDADRLGALTPPRFDAAVCSMALMDIAELNGLAIGLTRLLGPGGRFVFTVCHPAFNRSTARRVLDEEDREGEIVETRAVQVREYLGTRPTTGLAMIGQPVPQPYFDRSFQDLLAPFFGAGFVVDALEEAAFPPGRPVSRTLSWENFPEIPPLLGVRLRRSPTGSR